MSEQGEENEWALDLEGAFAVLEKVLSRLERTHETFLEEVLLWWRNECREHQRTEPVPPAGLPEAETASWHREAKPRLLLYQDLRDTNLRWVARHAVTPPAELENLRSIVQRIEDSRAQAGLERRHPTVSGEWGRSLLRAREFNEASAQLGYAVESLRGSSQVMVQRDFVDFSSDLARCYSSLANQASGVADKLAHSPEAEERLVAIEARGSHLAAAGTTVDEALGVAKIIDQAEERTAYDEEAAVPHSFSPAILTAYYQQLERYLYDPCYCSDPQIRGFYQHYWDEARAEGAPQGWSTTTKIGALSDPLWVQRHPQAVREIAEALFVQMASTPLACLVRQLRVRWWGIWVPNTLSQPGSRFPSAFVRAAAAVLLALAALGGSEEAGQFSLGGDMPHDAVVEFVDRSGGRVDSGLEVLNRASSHEDSPPVTADEVLLLRRVMRQQQIPLEGHDPLVTSVESHLQLVNNSVRGLRAGVLQFANNSVRGL